MIRVESEETQDYVRKQRVRSRKKWKRGCLYQVRSVFPQNMMFRCDKQCSEKSLSYWQLASVVINEGEESYTTNSCQKCFNNSLKAKGEKR